MRRGPRPAGRVGRRRAHGARRRDRRRSRRAPAARGRASRSSRCDPAPGMRPDVVVPRRGAAVRRRRASTSSPCRTAAHHFDDVAQAVARDGAGRARRGPDRRQPLHGRRGRGGREAARPSHVRNYSEAEWRAFVARRRARGRARCAFFEKPIELSAWLDRTRLRGRRGRPRPASCSATASHDGRLTLDQDRDPGGDAALTMAIIVDNDTRLVVQGLTGSEGRFHGLRNRAYGTNVVAGVTPGKGGQDVEGVPVFDTVAEAVARAGREHGDDLRPGAVRRRRRSTRRSTPASAP